MDTEGSYKCKCVLGWGGQNCQKGKFIKMGGWSWLFLDCMDHRSDKDTEKFSNSKAKIIITAGL